MAGCLHSLAKQQSTALQTSNKKSRKLLPPGHVFPALHTESGLTLQPKRTRRANHTVAAQPPRTRHDKPLRAQGIFAFHTSGQKGNDPCAIARGSPGEPGRAFGLAHWPFLKEEPGRGGDDDGDMLMAWPTQPLPDEKLFIEIVSTLLLARITHTGVITSQN
ncbi:hypothetical protein V8C43DRAFT_317333 [Trichoderma afarasin]